MTSEIDVRMGEMAVGSGRTILKTGGIGSCVVIIIYDDYAKVGGMAHAMLPFRKKTKTSTSDMEDSLSYQGEEAVAKYVDEAVDRLVKEVERLGGNKSHMEARLIGGAHMFQTVEDSEEGIGKRNLEQARVGLAAQEIKIHAEEVGGSVGRVAEMDLQNGIVNVITKM